MTQKTWARLSENNAVVELLTLDASLVPGTDIPATWTDDVTSVQGVAVGWIKNNKGVFAAPPPVSIPVVVPQLISRRQFFQQLAVQNVITQTEALAAVQTGAIPPEMSPLVTALPVNEQFAAEMMISGATEFSRTDPLTLELGDAKGWSPAQIDALWIAAAAL